jgi:RNA polymerase sigma factor (sigma-70 family)
MTQKTHDLELLEGFQRGDSIAFKELYQALQGQFFYFAVKVSGDEELAADLVAEGFIKLWQKKPSFATMTSLKSWMFTLIQNALNSRAAQIRHDASHKERSKVTGSLIPTHLCNFFNTYIC